MAENRMNRFIQEVGVLLISKEYCIFLHAYKREII